jgi:hypothetical protein
MKKSPEQPEEWNDFVAELAGEVEGFVKVFPESQDEKQSYFALYVAWFIHLISAEKVVHLYWLRKKSLNPQSLNNEKDERTQCFSGYRLWVSRRVFKHNKPKACLVALSCLKEFMTIGGLPAQNSREILEKVPLGQLKESQKLYIWERAVESRRADDPAMARLCRAFSNIKSIIGPDAVEKMLKEEVKKLACFADLDPLRERLGNWLADRIEEHSQYFDRRYPLCGLGVPETLSQDMLDANWNYLLNRTSLLNPRYTEFLQKIFHIQNNIVFNFTITVFRYLNCLPQEEKRKLITKMANHCAIPRITLITLYLCWEKPVSSIEEIESNTALEMQRLIDDAIRKIPVFKGESRKNAKEAKIKKLTTLLTSLEAKADLLMSKKSHLEDLPDLNQGRCNSDQSI